MGNWPTLSDGGPEKTFGLGASSAGAAITGGAANVKGAYAEIYVATEFETSLLFLMLHTIAASDYLVDIAIGAAGSEVIIIPDIIIRNTGSQFQPPVVWYPVALPPGTRLAARAQSASTFAQNRTLDIIIYGVD